MAVTEEHLPWARGQGERSGEHIRMGELSRGRNSHKHEAIENPEILDNSYRAYLGLRNRLVFQCDF